MSYGYWLFVAVVLVFLVGLMSGCSSTPVIKTEVVEKPVPIYCTVNVPAECKDAYAVDRVSVNDAPLMINRAIRIEIEERRICEIRLRAAVKGCGKQP